MYRWLAVRRFTQIAVVAVVIALAGAHAAAAKPLIVMDVGPGGFSASYRLDIATNGRVTVEGLVPSPKRFRIPRPAVRQIRQLATRLHFASLDPYYGPASATDQPTFTVTFGGHTVRTESGTPPAPERLWQLIGQLSEIADDGAHPPLLRLSFATHDYFLQLTVGQGGKADISDTHREVTRHLSGRCVARVRRTTRALKTSKLRIGAPLLPQHRDIVEFTHAYRSFHAWLDRPTPESLDRLVRLGRRIARGRC
jgi:hypothetical protein